MFSSPGYSGCKSRPHTHPVFVKSTHLTAKTHRGIPCIATRDAAAALPDRARRLQMLKDRRNG